MRRASLRFVLAGIFVLAFSSSAPAAERTVPGKLPSGETVLPNGRLLTPAGTQTEVSPYPFSLAFTPDGSRVVVACTGADDESLHLLDAKTGRVLAKEPVGKPSGGGWGHLLGVGLSADGSVVVYSLARETAALYLAEGLE